MRLALQELHNSNGNEERDELKELSIASPRAFEGCYRLDASET